MKILLLYILVLLTSCSTIKTAKPERLSIRDTSYTVIILDSMGHKDTTMHAVRVYYVEERDHRKVLVSLLLILGAVIWIIIKLH